MIGLSLATMIIRKHSHLRGVLSLLKHLLKEASSFVGGSCLTDLAVLQGVGERYSCLINVSFFISAWWQPGGDHGFYPVCLRGYVSMSLSAVNLRNY